MKARHAPDHASGRGWQPGEVTGPDCPPACLPAWAQEGETVDYIVTGSWSKKAAGEAKKYNKVGGTAWYCLLSGVVLAGYCGVLPPDRAVLLGGRRWSRGLSSVLQAGRGGHVLGVMVCWRWAALIGAQAMAKQFDRQTQHSRPALAPALAALPSCSRPRSTLCARATTRACRRRPSGS